MLRGVANVSDLHLPHTCYRTDPSIFGRFCHEGDYCIDGVAYSCGLMGGVAHKHGAALEALARSRGYGSSDNPLGNGLQTPKFFEALLMRTIPVCTRHLVFQKLFDLDWPMILVDDFTVLLDEGVLVNETRRAQKKMSRHFAQLSNVYGLWAYLHEGRFR